MSWKFFESIKITIKGIVSKHCIITNSCIIKLPNDNQNRSDSISILNFKYFEK